MHHNFIQCRKLTLRILYPIGRSAGDQLFSLSFILGFSYFYFLPNDIFAWYRMHRLFYFSLAFKQCFSSSSLSFLFATFTYFNDKPTGFQIIPLLWSCISVCLLWRGFMFCYFFSFWKFDCIDFFLLILFGICSVELPMSDCFLLFSALLFHWHLELRC